MKALIIGGGISGLSAAYYLKEICNKNSVNLDLKILEASDNCGGVISTKYKDNFILEEGPDSFITNKPYALELCNKLGLENQIISTKESNRKAYVYLNKKLHPLPDGFIMFAPSNYRSFFNSSLFSFLGKIRTLFEFFMPKKEVEDETVYSFISRRFGKEMYEKVGQPMLGGIYTGDSKKLSMKATMPQFVDLEKKYGSVLLGILRGGLGTNGDDKQGGARYALFASIKGGMGVLIKSIVDKLGDESIKLNCSAKKVTKAESGWKVETNLGEFCSDALILSTPSYMTSGLVNNFDSDLSSLLSEIEYASSVIVGLVYRKEYIKSKGFGVVIPEIEGRTTIAYSFSSEKFLHRAPSEFVIVRCFLGGFQNPEVVDWDENTIYEKTIEEIKDILELKENPEFHFIRKYIKSMPQYNLGHIKLVDKINKSVLDLSGISLAGSAYNGVGIPDCIYSGKQAAEKVFYDIYSS